MNANTKQKYSQQSVFNIYNQKMKINLNNSDAKGVPKGKKQSVGKSVVKDFSTGNLNLDELVDREDEYLSYTDPRHQMKRPKHSEKDDLIII